MATNSEAINLTCPHCNKKTRSNTVDTRGQEGYDYVRRRRQCRKCGGRFTTYEVHASIVEDYQRLVSANADRGGLK